MADTDIDFLVPASVTLVVDGEVLEISTLLMRELGPLLREIEPLLQTLLIEGETIDKVRLLSLMGQHDEAFMQAVAICVRKPVEWVGARLPDRVMAMAMAGIEVNFDFFTKALAAAKSQMQRLAPTLAARIMANPSLGPKASTS